MNKVTKEICNAIDEVIEDILCSISARDIAEKIKECNSDMYKEIRKEIIHHLTDII